MKNRKIDLILVIFLFFSFILFCLSFCVDKNKAIAIKSALVNPSYKKNISRLIIQDPENLLTLNLKNQFWICETNGLSTYANRENIDNFINKLTNIRNMYKISDNNNEKSNLHLTKENAVIVTVIDSSDKAVSKIYFGKENNLTSRIFVSNDKGRISYETENDLSSFLSTDINFWTVPEIFFITKNPSNLKINADKLHTLLSLRHGNIVPKNQIPSSAVFASSYTLYGQYEYSQRIDFYEYKNSDSTDYYYIQNVSPHNISENCAYELSSWSYNKLKDLLK